MLSKDYTLFLPLIDVTQKKKNEVAEENPSLGSPPASSFLVLECSSCCVDLLGLTCPQAFSLRG